MLGPSSRSLDHLRRARVEGEMPAGQLSKQGNHLGGLGRPVKGSHAVGSAVFLVELLADGRGSLLDL